MKHLGVLIGAVSLLLLSAGLTLAADRQDQVYGSQLMTPQERNEYQAGMRAAKTAAEREQIRQEHHDRMQERAKAQGVTLPDAPAMKGTGTGRGSGGMGQGGMGTGRGGGRGR